MKKSTIKIIDHGLKRYSKYMYLEPDILDSIKLMVDTFQTGGKIMICGNGGSAADALHIVGELMKSFSIERQLDSNFIQKLLISSKNYDYILKNLQGAVPAISLVNETSLISAFSNDSKPDLVFAQQVYGLGKSGDVLIAISTSGMSRNIILACEVATAKGIKVIGLTGKNGGELSKISDISLLVNENETYKIQEIHLPIYHLICLGIENELFGIENENA